MAFFINSRHRPPSFQTVMPVSVPIVPANPPTAVPPPPQPVTAPVVSKPVVWPADVPPTRIINIPEPGHAVSGVMDIMIRSGDETEFRIDPWWDVIALPSQGGNEWSSVESAIDEGNGFKPSRDYIQYWKDQESRGNTPRFSKKRVVRYHLVRGATRAASLRFQIDKKSEDDFKPLPHVPPQQFGSLIVNEIALQGVNGNVRIRVDLDFQNSSSSTPIAVAMYCSQSTFAVGAERLKSSLIAADGKEYWCDKDDMAGIDYSNANPNTLTEIAPGETRRVSLNFIPWNGPAGRVSMMKVQCEVVVNLNYNRGMYQNYRPTPGVLPPGCKIYNAVFDIPVRFRGR